MSSWHIHPQVLLKIFNVFWKTKHLSQNKQTNKKKPKTSCLSSAGRKSVIRSFDSLIYVFKELHI